MNVNQAFYSAEKNECGVRNKPHCTCGVEFWRVALRRNRRRAGASAELQRADTGAAVTEARPPARQHILIHQPVGSTTRVNSCPSQEKVVGLPDRKGSSSRWIRQWRRGTSTTPPNSAHHQTGFKPRIHADVHGYELKTSASIRDHPWLTKEVCLTEKRS